MDVLAMHPEMAIELGLFLKEPARNPFVLPFSFIRERAPDIAEIVEETLEERGEFDTPQF